MTTKPVLSVCTNIVFVLLALLVCPLGTRMTCDAQDVVSASIVTGPNITAWVARLIFGVVIAIALWQLRALKRTPWLMWIVAVIDMAIAVILPLMALYTEIFSTTTRVKYTSFYLQMNPALIGTVLVVVVFLSLTRRNQRHAVRARRQ